MQQELGLGACRVETETDKENFYSIYKMSLSFELDMSQQCKYAAHGCSSETRGGLDEHDSVAISEHDGGLKMIYSYHLNLYEKQENIMTTPPTCMHVTIRTYAFPLILKV
jgi:hypothetical protein